MKIRGESSHAPRALGGEDRPDSVSAGSGLGDYVPEPLPADLILVVGVLVIVVLFTVLALLFALSGVFDPVTA